MTVVNKLKKYSFGLLLFVYLLIASHGFNFIGWSFIVPQSVDYLVASTLLLCAFLFSRSASKVRRPLGLIIASILILPIFSVIFKLILGSNESLNIEIQYTFIPIASFSLYYIMRKLKVDITTIMTTLIIFGLLTFILQIYQQFYPESILFAGNENLDEPEKLIRNGIYRLDVGSVSVALVCMYYYWGKLLTEKFHWYNITMLSIFITSVYFYLTRQIIVATLLTIGISLFLHRSNRNIRSIILIVILSSVLLVFYFEELFGELIELTQDNTHSQDIRFEFIGVILSASIQNPLQFLFGHGGYTTIEKVWADKEYFVSDVGFFGTMWQYGFIYLLVYFYTFYLFAYKYGKQIPLFIRLYLIGTSINSMFIFPYRNALENYVWVMMLYVISCYYNRKTNNTNEIQCYNTCV